MVKNKNFTKRVMAVTLAMSMIFAGSATVWAEEASPSPAEDEAINVTISAPLSEEEKLAYAVVPSGMTIVNGSIYFADSNANVIRMQKKDGSYETIAGQAHTEGSKNGVSSNATFSTPWDIVSYKKGYAISDAGNNRIRLLKNGKVSNLVSKKLKYPTGLATGAKGELYIADTGNNRIMVLDAKGKLSVFAGSTGGCKDGSLKKAKFLEPTALYYYKKVLYVADSGNHRIVKIANGKVTTIAGSSKGVEGDKVGKAASARFSNPQGIVVKNDVVYIADSGNGSVKKLKKGKVSTLIEAFSLDGERTPALPRGMAIKGSTLYIGDVFAEELLQKKL